MTSELTLPQRVAELADVLGIAYRAAKARYDGDREFPLDEIPTVAAWLRISVAQITTGIRDREQKKAVA